MGDLVDRRLAVLHHGVQDPQTRRVAEQREPVRRLLDVTVFHGANVTA